MLSYRHAFHAGNWCDVVKHSVFCLILQSLNKKPSPYCIIDTHAGAGLYDLKDQRAVLTGEVKQGIMKLLASCLSKDDVFPASCYMKKEAPYVAKSFYLGSPCLALDFMRKTDRLELIELHTSEIDILQNNMKGKNAIVHFANGFEHLCHIVPPPQNRGLVLIDPSYETNSDFADVAVAVQKAMKKWHNGIYAIWYPLLYHKKEQLEQMKEELKSIAKKYCKNGSCLDMCLFKEEISAQQEEQKTTRLYGTGVFVINPCYLLEEKMEIVLKEYASVFLGSKGKYAITTYSNKEQQK